MIGRLAFWVVWYPFGEDITICSKNAHSVLRLSLLRLWVDLLTKPEASGSLPSHQSSWQRYHRKLPPSKILKILLFYKLVLGCCRIGFYFYPNQFSYGTTEQIYSVFNSVSTSLREREKMVGNKNLKGYQEKTSSRPYPTRLFERIAIQDL